MNQEEEEYDYLFKIALVGESGVGKSNLLSRFIKDEFNLETKATIGVEFGSKIVQHEDKTIKAQIWDTAGQERFRAITSSYYKGAMGALLVYDIARQDSFEALDRWVNEIKAFAQPEVTIVLVGNKSDLDYMREVAQEDAVSYAKQQELPFFETSALACTNVDTVFRELLVRIARKIDSNFDVKKDRFELVKNDTVKLSMKKNGGCCKKG